VFELESMTKAKVLDVRVLAHKDRKQDDPPGAQLLLQSTLPADSLACFDGFLPSMLYTKSNGAKQGALEGMDALALTDIGKHIKRLPWQYEQTGCEIEIDRGMGGKRNLSLADCKVHRVSLSPRDGGSVVLQYTIDAPGLQDAMRGTLTGLKRTEIELTIVGPDPDDERQDDLVTEGADATSGKR
jgi:hypothetical protein